MRSDRYSIFSDDGSSVTESLPAFADIIIVVFIAILPALLLIGNGIPEKVPEPAKAGNSDSGNPTTILVEVNSNGEFRRDGAGWTSPTALAESLSATKFEVLVLRPIFNDDIAAFHRAVSKLDATGFDLAFLPPQIPGGSD